MGGLFNFSGRSGRASYWKIALLLVTAHFLMYLLLIPQDAFINLRSSGFSTDWYFNLRAPLRAMQLEAFLWDYGWILYLVCLLPLVIASLAVQVRRWHDLGKSGWWILIGLIPIVGGLYAFVMQGFVAGTPGTNAYGTPAHAIGHPEREFSHSGQETHGVARTEVSDQQHSTLLAVSLVVSMAGFAMLFATMLIFRPWYVGNIVGLHSILALIALGSGIVFSDRLIGVVGAYRVALVSIGMAASATLFLALSFEVRGFRRIFQLDVSTASVLVIGSLLIIPTLNAMSAQLPKYEARWISLEALIVAPIFGAYLLTGWMIRIFGTIGGLGLAFVLLLSSVVILLILATQQKVEAGLISVPNAEEKALT